MSLKLNANDKKQLKSEYKRLNKIQKSDQKRLDAARKLTASPKRHDEIHRYRSLIHTDNADMYTISAELDKNEYIDPITGNFK